MAKLTEIAPELYAAVQVDRAAIAAIAASGAKTLINNRPDGEEADQPLAADIEAAAEAAGISYRHVPILRGIGPADVEAMQDALRGAQGGQALAFCRSGNRSALTWALAMRAEGLAREEIEQRVTDAGFNVAPIAHLL